MSASVVDPGSGVVGGARRLRVNPIACRGVGMCHLVAERVVGLDPWGFPIIRELNRPGDEQAARVAAAACPMRALFFG